LKGRIESGAVTINHPDCFHRRLAHPKLASEVPFRFNQLPQLVCDMGAILMGSKKWSSNSLDFGIACPPPPRYCASTKTLLAQLVLRMIYYNQLTKFSKARHHFQKLVFLFKNLVFPLFRFKT
jgi:hypothetical protein